MTDLQPPPLTEAQALNAWIGEKLFGLKVDLCPTILYRGGRRVIWNWRTVRPGHPVHQRCVAASTDEWRLYRDGFDVPAADYCGTGDGMLEVIEAMRELGFSYHLTRSGRAETGNPSAMFYWPYEPQVGWFGNANADTLPLAVCLAARKALEAQEHGNG